MSKIITGIDESLLFQVPSTITKITTMRDNTLRLQVDTDKEIPSEESAKVFELYNKSGNFVFAVSDIKREDVKVPDYAPIEKNEKTPSQRLRAVLFLLWKQSKQEFDSDTFYKRKMDEIIEHFKKQLD